jgi:hypothetical protein
MVHFLPQLPRLGPRQSVVSALAGYREDDFSMTGTGEPERVTAEMISASFFPLLGVQPSVGRAFLPEGDQVRASEPTRLASAWRLARTGGQLCGWFLGRE